MPKQSRTKRPETLNRTADIASFGASLRVGVDEPKDPEPEIEVKPWLETRGMLDAPVRQTSDIVLSVYPEARTKVGTARPPAVGSIIGVRFAVEVVVNLPHAEFDRLWSFALSGHLKHAWMAFTRPHYNRDWCWRCRFLASERNRSVSGRRVRWGVARHGSDAEGSSSPDAAGTIPVGASGRTRPRFGEARPRASEH
jgi:hypothetical protein